MANKVSDFYENTTKVFSGVITHNGSNPDTTNDKITFMLKLDKDDLDADALIDVDAGGLGSGGIFTITLSSTVTTIEPKYYYYEIIWYLSGNAAIYLLDQSVDKLRVIEKYQDNV